MSEWQSVINYILKSLNRFASFDGSMHPSEVQHSQWWVPNSTLEKLPETRKGRRYISVLPKLESFPLKIKLVFCSTGFPFQTFMWNIQSPENISSEHICVFALLMMFRQKFWDQGHTSHQESVAVNNFQFHVFQFKPKYNKKNWPFWKIVLKVLIQNGWERESGLFLQNLVGQRENWKEVFILTGRCK